MSTPPPEHAPPDPEPAALLALARPLAEEAGTRLVASLARARVSVLTKSSATDVVTEMDQAIEALIVESILRVRPEDGIEGEEGASRPGTSGVRWHIDPIDGTVNYVHGIPGFCVSIAAELDGAVVAGVVASPLHREVFTATRGGGAFCNDAPIRCSTGTDLALALVGTGFSYRSDRRARQAYVLTHVLPRVADIRRVGSAAIDLCWVACGRYDGYFETGPSTWDYAAGALVAAEAGAVVGDLQGGPPSTDFVVAAPAPLFGPLRDLLVAAGAAPFA
ncbi:MAG: inositol monophosphatase [Actinomycetota bacterium]|nr:inositol monophosphatase [Actinomycetota bacterium]